MEYAILMFLALCAVNIIAAKKCETDDDCEKGKECCIAKSFMKPDSKECRKYLQEGDNCVRNIGVMNEIFGFTFGVSPCGPGLTCATTDELLYTVNEEYDVYSTRCFKKFTSVKKDKKIDDVTSKNTDDISNKDIDEETSKNTDEVTSKNPDEVTSDDDIDDATEDLID